MKIPDLIHLLKTYQLRPDKSKGQHFLIDETVVADMLEAAAVTKDDITVEVGPGVGVLTSALSQTSQHVYTYELDDALATLIEQQGMKNITVLRGDVLQAQLPPDGVTQYKVLANIPYNITGLLVRQLLATQPQATSVTLLVQREVAERMVAGPGQMSVLAVATQLHGRARIVRQVAPEAFFPAPRVDSAVIHIELVPELTLDVDEKAFMRLVKHGFAQKRKQLKNTLAAGLQVESETIEVALKDAQLSPTARAQELSLPDWHRLMIALAD